MNRTTDVSHTESPYCPFTFLHALVRTSAVSAPPGPCCPCPSPHPSPRLDNEKGNLTCLLNGPKKGVGKCEQRPHCVSVAEMTTVLTAADRASLGNGSACCTSQIRRQEGGQPGHRESLSRDKTGWTLRRERGPVTHSWQNLSAYRVTTSTTKQSRKRIVRGLRHSSVVQHLFGM